MARKKLSAHGRALAAGVSVAVAGALAGFMAARDHTADASQPASSSVSPDGIGTSGAPSSGTPTHSPDDERGSDDTTGQFQPQPQTRTGGS